MMRIPSVPLPPCFTPKEEEKRGRRKLFLYFLSYYNAQDAICRGGWVRNTFPHKDLLGIYSVYSKEGSKCFFHKSLHFRPCFVLRESNSCFIIPHNIAVNFLL